MNALVGYTGFVGNNLYATGQFDALYNSKNIECAYGTNPKLLIFAGLRAEKYLANIEPEKDLKLICQAEENINRINPQKLVLISTIDVFKEPRNVDETSRVETEGLHAYGYNRYQLELWVRQMYPDALIVRLPSLFGKNIKKNFIYDYINIIPFMLNENKMKELTVKESALKKYYEYQNNGFYKVKDLTDVEKKLLRGIFRKLKFSALNFTDNRSKYQFYNLARLWEDIQIALNHEIYLWHPATEPISAGEIYQFISGKSFVNELQGLPANYDYKTIYSNVFGGSNGYICNKEKMLNDLKEFVKQY